MTLPSAIFSKSLIGCFLLSRLTLAGTVTGAVDVKRADRSEVVVWLEPLDTETATLSPRHARILQKDKKFHPHILVIRSGTTIDFPNADPIFHNAFSNFNGQIFDIGLYPPGKSRSIVFTNPGIVHVFCNIHPSMAAVIIVVNTPYFATSNASGQYTIADVPPGHYRLRVFSERSTPAVLNEVTQIIAVHDAPAVIPPITVSEAGYITTPHANKFAKPYPPGAGDPSAYTIPQ